MRIIQKTYTKRNLFIAGAIAFLLLAVYLGVAWQKNWVPFSLFNKTYEPGEQIVNMQRTDTEKQVTESIEKDPKQKLQNPQTDTPKVPSVDSTSGKQAVDVMITSAGIVNAMVNVSGMVSNLVEEGGVCTYVFTQGSQVVSKDTTTSTNPTSTTCTRLTMPATELPSTGTWKVTLRYTSGDAQGVSSEREIAR